MAELYHSPTLIARGKGKKKSTAFAVLFKHYQDLLSGLLYGLAGINEILDAVDSNNYKQLKEANSADDCKGPPGQVKNVSCTCIAEKGDSLQNACIAKSCGYNSLNEKNNTHPDIMELLGEHIYKHINPNMTLLDLHDGNCKHNNNNKEVRRKFVTTLDRKSLTADLAEDNVDSNDENHNKADSHTYIAYTADNLANSITYLFQVKFPLSKRMNKASIKILRKKNFKGTGPG